MIKFTILREVALACMRGENPITYYSKVGKMSNEVAEYELKSIVNDLPYMIASSQHDEIAIILNDYLNKETVKLAGLYYED